MVMVTVDGMLCEADVVRYSKNGTKAYIVIPFFYSQYKEEYRPGKNDAKYLWVDTADLI